MKYVGLYGLVGGAEEEKAARLCDVTVIQGCGGSLLIELKLIVSSRKLKASNTLVAHVYI